MIVIGVPPSFVTWVVVSAYGAHPPLFFKTRVPLVGRKAVGVFLIVLSAAGFAVFS